LNYALKKRWKVKMQLVEIQVEGVIALAAVEVMMAITLHLHQHWLLIAA
jgi:hypothetical protein